MIVKRVPADRTKGRDASIEDLVDYVCVQRLVDPSEKLLYANARGFHATTHAGRREEMIALATSCSRSPEPVRHYILSWREGERPTPAQIEQAVDLFLEELGWSEHQAIYALHHNTENLHLHIVVNRVHWFTERIADPNRRFDLEACHRAIARIEHAQGWGSEANALYRVDESGEVVPRTGWRTEGELPSRARTKASKTETVEERGGQETPRRSAAAGSGRAARRIRNRSERSARRVRTRARDAERWTGEKSVERVAIERAAPVLREARSWAEVHERLAALGFRYERVGSGAVLRVGEVAVKASAVDRTASLKRMEARLGAYQPAAGGLEIAPLAPEPLVPRMAESAAYVAARQEHFARKRAAKAALDRRHAEEREQLRAAQRAERERVFRRDWTGLGLLRAAAAKVLAEDHASQRAELVARQAAERAAWRRDYPPFPDIETWLRERHGADLAWAWRHQESLGLRADRPLSAPSLVAVGGAEEEPVQVFEIAAFRALRVGRAVHYLRAESRALAFVDHGRRIDVSVWEDEDALLAAMRLAALKWGSFTVEGSETFKAACVRLAAEHCFDLANPELASALAAERARLGADRKRLVGAKSLAGAIPRGVGGGGVPDEASAGASATLDDERVAETPGAQGGVGARSATGARHQVGVEGGPPVPGPAEAERQQSPPRADAVSSEDEAEVAAGHGVGEGTRAVPESARAPRVGPEATVIASDKTAPHAEGERAARGEEADRRPVSPSGATIPAGATAASAGTPRRSAEPAAAVGPGAGTTPASTRRPEEASASSGTAPPADAMGKGREPSSPATPWAEGLAQTEQTTSSRQPGSQGVERERRIGADASAAKEAKRPPAPHPQPEPEPAQTPEPEPPEPEQPALEEDEDDTPDPYDRRRRPGW